MYKNILIKTEFGPASSRFLTYETPFAPEFFREL